MNRANYTYRGGLCTLLWHILLVISSFLLATACTTTEKSLSEKASQEKQFHPEKLKEDLSFMMKTLEDVHPDLYASTDTDSIKSLQQRIESRLAEPHNPQDFYKIIAPLVANIGDGHTGVAIPYDGYSDYLDEGGRVFPYLIGRQEDGLKIELSYNNKVLLAGYRLLNINGMSADSLFEVFMSGMSGIREEFKEQRVIQNFRVLLWIHEIHSPYNIEYQEVKNGPIKTAIVKGVNRDEIKKINKERDSNYRSGDLYTYEFFPDSVAYIDFRSMRNSGEFGDFLEDAFTDINVKKPAGLIIDLRNNGGGDSRLGVQLLDYITAEPYKMSSGKAWKMSRQYKKYLREYLPRPIRWISYPPAIWIARVFRSEAKLFMVGPGRTVNLKFPPVKPGNNPLRYNGKVVFLIGRGTHSSAMMLANAVEDYDIATLIGEETGGIPNQFGEVYPFNLPHSNLRITSSSAKFIRANGDAENTNAVLPDIVTSNQTAKSISVEDYTLEVARDYIKSSEQ